jgi:polysaccharide pyruvyl transferase WcaK-like protein
VRIHLGHHFYGAGNLGDDFMLAGFLAAMRTVAPGTTYTCCVPFALEPLQRRFREINWLAYDDATRIRCIEECDVWLGLGGSPFQSAQSRWFIDHLVAEQRFCATHHAPMFYLGVGVQTAAELASPEAQQVCAHAAGIWTRDSASAERLRALLSPPPIAAAADLAHVFFRDFPPPPAVRGRITLVANFDYGTWPGQPACLAALEHLSFNEAIWLAQESRDLPGAERALYARLSATQKSRWPLASPEQAGAPLSRVLANWPSGEWLVTARYHAALAGAWAGSKIVVLSTNEKLRAVAQELSVPLLSPEADENTVARALATASTSIAPLALAQRAYDACAEFVRSAVAHRR